MDTVEALSGLAHGFGAMRRKWLMCN
jgi:hypothetical protein